MFPFLEIYFLWMIPRRQRLHEELVQFKAMLRNVIAEKRKKVESGQAQNENLEDNEKDLLTMMLESEMQGEGKMTNDELEVIIKNDQEKRSYLTLFWLYVEQSCPIFCGWP
jgi:cholesterol 24(S)-hydroxylase